MPQRNKKYNILILSNEVNIINRLSVFFEKSLYNFELVKDPLVVLNKVQNENYDLIIINSIFSKKVLEALVSKIDFLDSFTYTLVLTDNNNMDDDLDVIKKHDVQAFYNKDNNFQNLVILVSLIANSIYEFTRININLGGYGETSRSPYLNTVEILRNIGEYKDIYTIGHSFRVSEFSKLIGRQMGLSKNKLKTLQIGSMFHDIGKIAIPNAILTKDSRLTDNEYYQIKFHPTLGAHILYPIPLYEKTIPIIKYHHEKFNGKGYPLGLKGKEIPFYARIVAVADTFDAMTSKRSYRDALPLQVAADEIIRNRGFQFDPEVVDAFLEILKNDYDKIVKIRDTYKYYNN